MKKQIFEFVYRAAIVLAILCALYVVGYLATVCKDQSISFVKAVPQGELTFYNVGAHHRGGMIGGRIGYILYSPMYKLDSGHFRRHYWSPYSVIVGAGRTNIIYECDERQKAQ